MPVQSKTKRREFAKSAPSAKTNKFVVRTKSVKQADSLFHSNKMKKAKTQKEKLEQLTGRALKIVEDALNNPSESERRQTAINLLMLGIPAALDAPVDDAEDETDEILKQEILKEEDK